MNKLFSFSRFGLIVAFLAFLSSATVVAQNTYTVGGAGADYTTLEALRISGILRDGDTIVLNGNDNSLTEAFTNTLTLRGAGSPTGSFGGSFGVFSRESVTFDSASLEFGRWHSPYSGGIYTLDEVWIASGTNTFFHNNFEFLGYHGGAIRASNGVSITGGVNTFSSNRAIEGGAIFAGDPNRFQSLLASTDIFTIASGINTFANNMAVSGGAIGAQGDINIIGGTNTFSDNSTHLLSLSGQGGGAISTYRGDVNIGGGINTFSNNTAGRDGGAICVLDKNVNITGGINMFSGNTATGIGAGGAIFAHDVNITGGTNTFFGNTAAQHSGAIFIRRDGIFRATDGNFTFQGNREWNGTPQEKANAIHAFNFGQNGEGNRTLTLAAEAGRNIFFYDPIRSNADRPNLTVNINNRATDTGMVVFDGSLYGRDVDRFSEIYGNTSVGYGELALKGNVTYGGASNVGSFTLNESATLSSDATTNRIQANSITMNGTVDIAHGGTLELAAANGVHFGGILSIGLGTLAAPDPFEAMLFSAFSAPSAFNTPVGAFSDPLNSTGLNVFGDLTFGTGATMSLYWDDFTPTDDWSFSYNLYDFVGATGTISGLENLLFDMSAFYAYDGFNWTWNNGLLLLSYTANDPAATPEPATLAVLGLGLAGLGYARARRRRK